MAIRLTISKPVRWVFSVMVLALVTLNAQADIWGYVDEQGVSHFASERVDARYQLFSRTDVQNTSTSDETTNQINEKTGLTPSKDLENIELSLKINKVSDFQETLHQNDRSILQQAALEALVQCQKRIFSQLAQPSAVAVSGKQSKNGRQAKAQAHPCDTMPAEQVMQLLATLPKPTPAMRLDALKEVLHKDDAQLKNLQHGTAAKGSDKAARLVKAEKQLAVPVVDYTQEVLQLQQLQKRVQAALSKAMDSKHIQKMIQDAASVYKLPAELITAMMAVESGFNKEAVSGARAVGLMQVIAPTAERFGVSADEKLSVEDKLKDPKINIATGVRYLKYLTTLFPERLDLVIASYNAGEGAVQKAGNKVPNYKETQNYVKTVLQIYVALKPAALLHLAATPAAAHISALSPTVGITLDGSIDSKGAAFASLGARPSLVSLNTNALNTENALEQLKKKENMIQNGFAGRIHVQIPVQSVSNKEIQNKQKTLGDSFDIKQSKKINTTNNKSEKQHLTSVSTVKTSESSLKPTTALITIPPVNEPQSADASTQKAPSHVVTSTNMPPEGVDIERVDTP